jgi:NAD(P)-dependent dehydrogenase (short-subunit alcohol dehydrogenase family)
VSRYLLTGASGGLGGAVYAALRERGDTVVTIGRREADLLADLSMMPPEPITRAVQLHADTGFDGIVHCAGAEVVAPLRMTRDDQYRTAMMAADTAFALLRAAAKKGVMVDGASIVMLSSVAAHRGTAGMAAYSAGKAAIEAMVRCAALELAPRRIRVNAVAAGAFRSPMHDRITSAMPAPAVDAYQAKHPLGFAHVNAVADVVLHLLSVSARWTTGTTVVVDGGFLAG